MKCVICHNDSITEKTLEEQVSVGKDIILVPVKAHECQVCGERYFTRQTMKYLEDVERQLKHKTKPLREIGKILAFE